MTSSSVTDALSLGPDSADRCWVQDRCGIGVGSRTDVGIGVGWPVSVGCRGCCIEYHGRCEGRYGDVKSNKATNKQSGAKATTSTSEFDRVCSDVD